MKFNLKTRKLLTIASMGVMLMAPTTTAVMAATPASNQVQAKTLKDGSYDVNVHAYKTGQKEDSMSNMFFNGAQVTVKNGKISRLTVHFDLSKLPAGFKGMTGGKKLDTLIQSLSINGQSGTKKNISADGSKFDLEYDGAAYKERKGSLNIILALPGMPLNENADLVFGALPAKAYEQATSSSSQSTSSSTTSSSQPIVSSNTKPKAEGNSSDNKQKNTTSKSLPMTITKTGSKEASEAAMFLGKQFKLICENGKPVSFAIHVDGSKSTMTKGQDMTKMISSMSIDGVAGKQENISSDHSQFDYVFPISAYKAGKSTLAVSLNVMGRTMNEKCDLTLADQAGKMPTSKPAKTQKSHQAKAKKYEIKHNSCLYNKHGKRIGKRILKAGTVVKATGVKTIKGIKYCQLSKNRFVKAGNIIGHKHVLKRNAYVYHRNGRHYGKLIHKGKKLTTYGSIVKLHGKRFYHIAANKYVKVANF